MKGNTGMGRWLGLGLVWGIGMLGAGGVQAGVEGYACSNCTPPACFCPSLQPPGGLSPATTPQLVVLTFDDQVHSNNYALARQVLAGHTNPNGQSIKATFFVCTLYSDYRWANRLYAEGHEIAMHSMSHATGTNTDLATWRAEIAGGRKMLSELAGIPLTAIRGFRAPYFLYTYDSLRIAREVGLTYDASVVEWVGGMSPSAAAMVWPYTLDCGVAEATLPAPLPREGFPGLFEIPVWSYCDTNGLPVAQQDPPGTAAEVLATLQYNFLAHYAGNRAPLGVFLHAGSWLTDPAHVTALNDFIAWARANFSDAWFVTCSDLVAFMKNPCTSAAASTQPWAQTLTTTPLPDAAWRFCQYYGSDGFSACRTCPPAYPMPETVYGAWTPLAGGTLQVQLTPVSDRTLEGTFTVTNTTSRTIPAWQVSLQVADGALTQVYGGTLATNGAQATVQRTGWLAPGASAQVSFTAKSNSPAFAFQDTTLQLYALETRRPRIQTLEREPSGQLRVIWDDAAFGYRLETAETLLPDTWRLLTTLRYQTNWTLPQPTNALWQVRVQAEP